MEKDYVERHLHKSRQYLETIIFTNVMFCHAFVKLRYAPFGSELGDALVNYSRKLADIYLNYSFNSNGVGSKLYAHMAIALNPKIAMKKEYWIEYLVDNSEVRAEFNMINKWYNLGNAPMGPGLCPMNAEFAYSTRNVHRFNKFLDKMKKEAVLCGWNALEKYENEVKGMD